MIILTSSEKKIISFAMRKLISRIRLVRGIEGEYNLDVIIPIEKYMRLKCDLSISRYENRRKFD